MVFDFRRQPEPEDFGNSHKSEPEVPSQFNDPSYHNRNSGSQQSKHNLYAQAAPIARPIGMPGSGSVPGFPWLTPGGVDQMQQLYQQGLNPFTRQPIGSEAEEQAIKSMTIEQAKGFKKSKYHDELRFAHDAFRNKKSCSIMELGILNGGQPKSMMVDALTGAIDPTLIIDPKGHAALFDGRYQGDEKKHARLKNRVYEVEPIMPPMNKVEEDKAFAFMKSKVPEWEYQSVIANQCGYDMVVAIPDEDLVKRFNTNVKLKHPGLKIVEAKLGGTYGIVRANTVGGQVHHTPADEVSSSTTAKGTGFWMYQHHHEKTASYGPSDKAKDYRAVQKKLIDQGKTTEAMLMDIKNVQNIAPKLYDIPIRQMMKKHLRSKLNAGRK